MFIVTFRFFLIFLRCIYRPQTVHHTLLFSHLFQTFVGEIDKLLSDDVAAFLVLMKD